MKIIYGLGIFVNNLLAAIIGGMIIVLNLALVRLFATLSRLTDAITESLMGCISHNTGARLDRPLPYIFIGVIFALLWQFPRGYVRS